jgi:cyanophycinase
MSQFMISLGDEGVTPRQRSSQLSAGLGLVTGVVVDQHFDQRGRYGRLLSIVANSPNLIGIGIDENTAAEIRDERLMSVVGAGAVFVLDARHAITDAPEARRGAPLLVSGAVVHTLPAGPPSIWSRWDWFASSSDTPTSRSQLSPRRTARPWCPRTLLRHNHADH